MRLERPGRGGALRSIWSASDADVLAYMDVDLSTDLNALLPLLAPLLSGHSDLAIGTRLARGARVVRGPTPRDHLPLLQPAPARHARHRVLRRPVRLQGHPRRRRPQLLPLTTDTGWFFDTELLVLAERAGLRIHEVPVDWIDDADSRVHIIATALADLRGIIRLGTGLARGTISVPVLGSPSPPGLQRGGKRASTGGRPSGPVEVASWRASSRLGWPAPRPSSCSICCSAGR